jgi:methylmalonyl-CoA mutase cobalamin-binding subunit
MFVYPGGTVLDPHRAGYSFSQNFLSDLGMTVTHSGQSNAFGAGLFMASFGLMALAVFACAVGFVRIHSSAPRARFFARAGGIGALLVGGGLIGAALSPANVATSLHMSFATMASAAAPASVLLFGVASARDRRFPLGVSVAWYVLAGAASAWFAMRWGPPVTTSGTLTFYATVQKAVAITVVGAVIYQTHRGGAVAVGVSSSVGDAG